MNFCRQILPVIIDKNEKQGIIASLSSKYKPFLGAGTAYLRSIGLNGGSFKLIGDIFLDPNSSTVYYLFLPENKNYLEAGYWGQDGEEPFIEFKSAVLATIIGGRQLDSGKWKDFIYNNRRFNLFKECSLPMDPSMEERQIATLLTDDDLRNLMKEIYRRGECFVGDVIHPDKQQISYDLLERLSTNGLINKDYFVFCRKTEQQISRFFNIEAIQEASNRGLKCPHCGKTFMDERIEQGLSVTDKGAEFADSDLWFALYLLTVLENLNISPKNIAIREENGYRQVDACVNHFGKMIYIFLKDASTDLTDIYMFIERIKIYKPDIAIFVSEIAQNDNTRRFIEMNSDAIIIDSPHDMQISLSELFHEIEIESVRNIISMFNHGSVLNLDRITADTMFKANRDRLTSYMARIKETAEEKASEPIQESVSLQPSERYEEFAGEAALEELNEELSPEIEETPSADSSEDSMDDFFMIEESFATDFGSPVNVSSIPELSPEERQHYENVKLLMDNIKSLVTETNLIGAWGRLDDFMANLPDSVSVTLFMTNGLPIISYNSFPDVNRIVALSADLLNNVSDTMPEEHLRQIILDTVEYNIYLTQIGKYNMLLSTKKSSSLYEGFNAVSTPEIRSSIVPKVFSELNRIDGIKGNMLVSEEYEILEKEFSDNKHGDLLADNFASAWSTYKPLVEKMVKEETLRQFAIRTDENIYSLFTFKDGTMFITLMEPNLSREVWNLKITDSARMLA